MLTLCFVADASNIHVKRWLGYFAEKETEYRVYCLSDKPGEIDGVSVHPLPNCTDKRVRGKRVTKTTVLQARSKAIQAFCKVHRVDILHGIFLYQRGWAAALCGKTPLVLTLLGSDVYLPPQNYRSRFHLLRDKLLNALSLNQADLITAVSADLCQAAGQQLILKDKRPCIELIPIGTDTALFHDRVNAEALRTKLDLNESHFVVLSPRQITPHYNQKWLIESIPYVLKAVPNAVFILKDAFCNTNERKHYVNSLKALADTLKVSSAIRWVSEVPMAELPAYYTVSDVVVSIPKTDGMPVSLFESMACKRPVIVSDLPAYNHVITHGQTGLRVPLDQNKALAKSIEKIYNNPALAERLVEESQVVLYQYGIFNEQMRRMAQYYNTIARVSQAKEPCSFFSNFSASNFLVSNFLIRAIKCLSRLLMKAVVAVF
ncbi:MAG: glycosyltransferase family 4 protein [Cyanobacteria bacterium P01_H01_bin.74]